MLRFNDYELNKSSISGNLFENRKLESNYWYTLFCVNHQIYFIKLFLNSEIENIGDVSKSCYLLVNIFNFTMIFVLIFILIFLLNCNSIFKNLQNYSFLHLGRLSL